MINQEPIRIQFRTLRQQHEDILKRAGNTASTNDFARYAMERYFALVEDEFVRLSAARYFSFEEELCIIEACQNVKFDVHNMSLLPKYVQDGIVSKKLDEKWEIDKESLYDKVHGLTPLGKQAVVDMCEQFWVLDRDQRKFNVWAVATSQGWPRDLIQKALITFDCETDQNEDEFEDEGWSPNGDSAEMMRDEASILWLHDPNLFPFVREAWAMQAGRNRAISLRDKDGRVVVGYATLSPAARSIGEGRFYRRFFYVMPGDRCFSPDGPYKTGTPSEGVDPLTVKATVPGKKTKRADSGLPTPKQLSQLQAILAAQREKNSR